MATIEQEPWQPKTDHTDAEKIAGFDRLHKLAMEIWERAKRDATDDDDAQWCKEAVMLLLGPTVFEAIIELRDLHYRRSLTDRELAKLLSLRNASMT